MTRETPAPTYHPGNSAVWIVPSHEDGAREAKLMSPAVVQAYMGQAHAGIGASVYPGPSTLSPSSSTPDSAGGPFTPTVACDHDGVDVEDSISKEFRGDDSFGCGVEDVGEGTLDSLDLEPDFELESGAKAGMGPDETVRLIRSSRMY